MNNIVYTFHPTRSDTSPCGFWELSFRQIAAGSVVYFLSGTSLERPVGSQPWPSVPLKGRHRRRREGIAAKFVMGTCASIGRWLSSSDPPASFQVLIFHLDGPSVKESMDHRVEAALAQLLTGALFENVTFANSIFYKK